MSSLSHLTGGLDSYKGGLIQAATRSRYKSSSNSFKFPEDPVFHLRSIILFPQHVLDEPLSSSVRNQGVSVGRLLLHRVEMGMDVLPKCIVQGKGGWVRSEQAGVKPQATGVQTTTS